MWKVVSLGAVFLLCVVLFQQNQTPTLPSPSQVSTPGISTSNPNIEPSSNSTTRADKLVGTWRDAKTGEERRFDSDGTMWIKFPHQVSDASPESRAFDFSGDFVESGTYSILTDGRIEISRKFEPAKKWEASLYGGQLSLRGPDGSHLYDVAPESMESRVLKELQRGGSL